MKKIELLAPAGSMESFYAAIEAGCDAVYMAGYAFGARAFASNFSDEEIIYAIKYAHLYGVKVYITVNTIIYENEVTLFMNYVDFLYKNNVDALIIQDLGMFDLIRKTYPHLPLHISTQMHIHNTSGATLMHALGAERVVLARETSIETIKEIKEKTDVELEVFVHGALCFSYSGECLFSSLIGDRSGNRGKCVGSCRLKYDIVDDNNKKYNMDDYPLSMKDLCTIERLGELIEIGIDSFKIEGRMKRPEYVYLVVSIYRKAIDNYIKTGKTSITNEDILDLKKIYNRSFTEGYLFGKKDVVNSYRPNHLGINIGKVINKKNNGIYIKLNDNLNRGDGIRFLNKNEDAGLTITKMFLKGEDCIEAKNGDIIVIKDKVLCDINSIVVKTTDKKQIDSINEKLKNKTRKVLIDGHIIVRNNEKVKISVTDNENNINIESEFIVDKSINKPITKEDVIKQFNKLNDTPYKFNKLEIDIDNNSFIPISKLNELRRIMVEKINEQRLYKIDYHKHEYEIELPDYKHFERITALINSKEVYNLIKNRDYYNIYMNKDLYKEIDDPRKILKLSRVTNINEGGNNILVSEIGSLMDGCITDFSFNVVNSYAVAFLHSIGINRVTLSHELDDNQIKQLIDNYINRYHKKPNLELIVYGREEMMITKYDLLNTLKNNYYLKDKYNNKMPIIKYSDITTIYNFKIKNRQNLKYYYDLGINYLRYEFQLKKDV